MSNSSQRCATFGLCPSEGHQRRPKPERCETTSAKVCKGVMLSNSWLIWKVRTIPRPTRSLGASVLMSSPSSTMRPALGCSTPVSRLMKVVLPAPLGPISAWRAPFFKSRLTPLVATMPPKRISSPWADNTVSLAVAALGCKTVFMAAPYGQCPARSRGGSGGHDRPAPAPPGKDRSRTSSTAA